MRFRRPRRWSDLDRVERVDSYTRLSLYLLLWIFCGSVLVAAVTQDADPVPTAAVVAVLLGAVVVTALGTVALAAVIDLHPASRPLPRRALGALVVAAAYLATIVATTDGDLPGAAAAVVVVNLAGVYGGVPDRALTMTVVLGSGAITGLVALDPRSAAVGVVVAACVVFSVRASLWLLGVVAELDETRQAQTRLAVAEERLRFSRDVHDVLGRRLSTIAVQAELAATLAARGDERAVAQMLDVRAVAHDALAEARELARGYRPTDLPSELEGARSLLRSAGIEVHLDVGVVPRGWHEAAGWVVREAVTNVLRHSDAAQVQVAYADEVLLVANDGVAADRAEVVEGTGLRGLRERLGALGATFEVRCADGRWEVAAGLPTSGPLGARVPAEEAAS